MSKSEGTQSTNAEIAELGLASAALMHDLQAMIGTLQEYAALVVEELEASRSPLSEARSVLTQCDEIQTSVHDVVAVVAGRMPALPFDPIESVHREINRVARRVAPLIIHCRSTLPPSTVVEGRSSLLERSVGNLLVNAARHARERIEVTLVADRRGDVMELLVAVEDDGPGIADGMRSQLFAPGARGDAGGTGMGLASVEWSVRRLGGQVSVAEARKLGGARFEIRIPLRPVGGEVRDVPGAAILARPLAGRTIALLDDDEMVRRSVTRLLARAGARVVTVDLAGLRSGESIDELAALAPDVVLLDLNLGGVSGVEIWFRMRECAPMLAERVAFFSGAAGWAQADEALAATGRPIIAKGMEYAEFLAAVDRLARQVARAGR
ncbi:MAG: ATP-binding protein [Gemmatimonadota bacterium]|nr:ATP-binding protein [Gemmatimonadota bacterium]